MSYTPEPVPTDTPEGLKRFLADELRRISAELARASAVTVTGVEPARRWNSMIVYAVAPWATSLGAEGFYGYELGSWTKL